MAGRQSRWVNRGMCEADVRRGGGWIALEALIDLLFESGSGELTSAVT
jgi:hypothetical protein